MKTLILILMMTAGPTAMAQNFKMPAYCGNGEELRVYLKKSTEGKINATVIAQSVGDSYPRWQYRDLGRTKTDGRIAFSSRAGSFTLAFDPKDAGKKNFYGYLTQPSQSIFNRRLNCAIE